MVFKLYAYRLVVIMVGLSMCSWNTLECSNIEVRIEVTHTTNNLNNGTIELIFSNQPDDFDTYLIIKGKKELLKDGKVDSLPKGKYDVIVTGKTVDTKYCPKYMNVTIN